MEHLDLEKVKQAIDAIPDIRFDSHRLIKELVKQHEDEYIMMLKPHQGGFRELHGTIGRFLSSHQEEFNIQKIETQSSENVKGYESRNALWEKKNKH